ncbi:hypothetical protein HMI49_03765 [Corallococcus exercitus]|uniref:Uncharacterized protein n=1 Tax=Corallococcus exercitus TaxID=2316736 RepID=A0A7Y4NQM7_9BACT|nr:hypothetical protein [Corallococcus exercitus]NOK32318.1 hypothetical protein [Corallococcus exercitus]
MDYIITGIDPDWLKSRIESYEVRPIIVQPRVGRVVGTAQMWRWEDVARAILNGKTFMTATKAANGNWDIGAEVDVILRSKSDHTAADNLDNLPQV